MWRIGELPVLKAAQINGHYLLPTSYRNSMKNLLRLANLGGNTAEEQSMRYQWRPVSKMMLLCTTALTITSSLGQSVPISDAETLRDQQKEFTIQNKYLIIPIQDGTRFDDMKSQLRLYVNDEKVHHYRINLADSAKTTDWYAYLTIDNYTGRQARVEVDNVSEEGFALVKQSDTIPGENNFFKEP